MVHAIYRVPISFQVMTSPPIVLQLEDAARGSGWFQPLAGGLLWSDRPVGAAAQRAIRPSGTEVSFEHDPQWTVVYDGPGLVDGGLRTIRSLHSTRGSRRVEYEDGECFLVDAGGDVVLRRGSGRPDSRSLERALGAPLALALARRGVHLLHASAIVRRAASEPADSRGGVLAFTAASGAGKSTLAATAQRLPALGWERIADDQLPVRLDSPAAALPHFPQLKLAEAEGYPFSAPAVRPLEALFEIEHAAAVRDIQVERLAPGAACLALARATVAAKLFDPALLERHFEQCVAAAAALPVYRLRYPSGLERLPEVLAQIAALTTLALETRK